MNKRLILLFSFFFITLYISPVYAHSIEDIVAKWKELRPTHQGTALLEEPSINAPYTSGKLNTSFLEDGLKYLNFCRYLAYLPEVYLDESLNQKGQHGAVLLAASEYSHHPPKPTDMSDSFYEIAHSSTSSSNIASGCKTLPSAIQSCMDDNSTNIDRVGHRRWLLNPTLHNIGFGYARKEVNSLYDYYITTQVFDQSGKNNFFQYISWPSNGYFPNNFFKTNVPWSITLNSAIYQTPDIEKVNVTITRPSDGSVWNISKKDKHTTLSNSNLSYFNVETSGYGISNCIIFYPGLENFDREKYTEPYTVKVTGIQYKHGINPANMGLSNEPFIEYTVNFFDLFEITEIKIEVNNKRLDFYDMGFLNDYYGKPFIEDGRILIPLRAICNALSISTSYDDKTETITCKETKSRSKPKEVKLKINSNTALINNQETTLDVPAKIIDDRTYVPLRFLSQSFNASVEWDEDKQLAKITK